MDTGVWFVFVFLQKVKVNHTNCLHLHNVSDKAEQNLHSKRLSDPFHFTSWKKKKKPFELMWATGADLH